MLIPVGHALINIPTASERINRRAYAAYGTSVEVNVENKIEGGNRVELTGEDVISLLESVLLSEMDRVASEADAHKVRYEPLIKSEREKEKLIAQRATDYGEARKQFIDGFQDEERKRNDARWFPKTINAEALRNQAIDEFRKSRLFDLELEAEVTNPWRSVFRFSSSIQESYMRSMPRLSDDWAAVRSIVSAAKAAPKASFNLDARLLSLVVPA